MWTHDTLKTFLEFVCSAAELLITILAKLWYSQVNIQIAEARKRRVTKQRYSEALQCCRDALTSRSCPPHLRKHDCAEQTPIKIVIYIKIMPFFHHTVQPQSVVWIWKLLKVSWYLMRSASHPRHFSNIVIGRAAFNNLSNFPKQSGIHVRLVQQPGWHVEAGLSFLYPLLKYFTCAL